MSTLISEPMPTFDDGCVMPRTIDARRPSEELIRAAGYDLLDVHVSDFRRAWLRPALPEDAADESWACEYRSPDCGHDCGCWIITNARDPRRVQPVWWIQ